MSAEKGLTPEQIKAGATALYSCGVTVPAGVVETVLIGGEG